MNPKESTWQQDEYTCAMCGKTYRYKWSHEEARQEAIDNFNIDPDNPTEPMMQICDDCYNAITIGGKPINFN